MKNSKLYRNIWLLGGLGLLLFTYLNLINNKSTTVVSLDGIACILFFINAYIHHKAINKA